MSPGLERLPLEMEIAAMQELAAANIKAIGDARSERIAALLAAYDGVAAPTKDTDA